MALTASRSALRTTAARPGRLACTVAPTRPVCLPQRRASHIARAQDTETSVDVDKLVKDLQDKWDKVENKTSVVLYGVGAIVLIWFSNTLVTALNSIPLLPKLMELVGLGYTSWFIYRYLLFKSSREELVKDVDELKKKITGEDGTSSTTKVTVTPPAAAPVTPRVTATVRSAAAADDE